MYQNCHVPEVTYPFDVSQIYGEHLVTNNYIFHESSRKVSTHFHYFSWSYI